MRRDPDAVPLDFDWADAVLVVPPKKQAISIRVDEDVLGFFKRGGPGYQRRINAVLRSYVHKSGKSEPEFSASFVTATAAGPPPNGHAHAPQPSGRPRRRALLRQQQSL